MTLVAPRIVNDLPYVSTVNHDIHFEWQAPYLLRCVGDACSMYFTGNNSVYNLDEGCLDTDRDMQ